MSSLQLAIAAPRTPTAQRSQSVFPSPSDCPGPRTPIKALGTPGRSKFGLARSEIGTSSSVAKISGLIAGSPHRSPSPSPRREASVVSDIKPTQTELGLSSGRAASVARSYRARSITRAGSVASSLSPSESASQIGTGSRAQSTISRASRAVPYPLNSRARTMTRSPAPPVREPLFSNPDDDDDDGDDDGITCLSPGGDLLDYTPDDDDNATILPEAGGKRLAATSPSKSSRVSGATSSVGSIVDTPKFKPHPLGMDSVELQMLNQDILSLLFANPANKEGLKDICSEYGFQSPVDLKRMMTETIRRAADSNDGKFLTTSIEDPRKSYKRVINTPDNPFSLD
ncbi:hypothetical protein FFLO_02575 [Filobasidium floriforme]|uniref:Uncharacterized protein n=1 Tax=Filobasidium floriforme TaxID=5210 RepID=A0A8K0JMF0_9TREE|nr:hypothetical protein FFLO_02575 [Filobasidium floriforme]